MIPNFSIENGLKGVIAGIDEVGRGSICGSVYAACVVLNREKYPEGINDSKKLSEKKREEIFKEILEYEERKILYYGIGSVTPIVIDQINIRNATKLAMEFAYANYVQKYVVPEINTALIDGDFIPSLIVNSIPIIKGDQKSLSIACASIIAKVTRDREMCEMDPQYPQYGWIRNKGYGTKEHKLAIKKYGLVKGFHRRTFCHI